MLVINILQFRFDNNLKNTINIEKNIIRSQLFVLFLLYLSGNQ